MMNPLKYPVGQYEPNKNSDDQLLAEWIHEIESFPSKITALTTNLSREELAWKYRPGGWSIKQLVHHCADSHLNSIIRFKLALTEELPEIRPYYEDRWAELPDSLDDDIGPSLDLIHALHGKWVILLKSLTDTDLKKQFVHPEHGATFNLAETIGNYAWHCRHHLAHIKLALESNGSNV